MKKTAVTLLALLLTTACVTWTPRSARTSADATVIANMPMQKWGIESCGAGSLSTVLEHYGDPMTMNAWDAKLPKTRGGVMTIDMLLAARERGFDAHLVTGNRANVEDELAQGRPVILMLQVIDSPGHAYDFFHYVVADGIDRTKGLVRTQFGDGKARWVTFDRLEKSWSGGGHAAIFIRPHDAMSEGLRAAVALEDEGKYADAAAKYRELLASNPSSALAWTNLGNSEMQLGDRKAAEDAFRKALGVDANSRDAMNNLAWLLLQEKRLDEAESFARKAAAADGPDSYMVLDTLARVLAAKGACGEAVTTFRHAIDSVPATHADAKTDLESAMAETERSCRS